MKITWVAAALAVLAGFAAPAWAITEGQVLDFVTEQAAQKYQVAHRDVQVKWEGARLATLAAGKLPDEARFQLSGPVYRLVGTMNVPIQVWDKGEKVATIFPRLAISVMQDVAVSITPIAKGTPVSPANTRLERRSVGLLPAQPFTTVDGLSGAMARRDVPRGTVLSASMVEIPAVVKSGNTVTVRLLSGDLTVFTSGQVLEDGRPGQTVRVVNPTSRKNYQARVVGPDLVEVRLEGDD